MFKVFEGVLPVLLLGTHVLLQQAKDVTRLPKTDRQTDCDEMDRTSKTQYIHQIKAISKHNPWGICDTKHRQS